MSNPRVTQKRDRTESWKKISAYLVSALLAEPDSLDILFSSI